MTARDARRFTVLILAVLIMAACASGPPKPSNVKLTLQAAADVNPDANGRPSPVVVRILQLKASDGFNTADFFPLYDDPEKLLGPDLIKREEYTLRPGDSNTVSISISGEARFVGVMAAFRSYREASWRVVNPAPLKKNALIMVGRARVDLSSR